jgi:hypothetical protein
MSTFNKTAIEDYIELKCRRHVLIQHNSITRRAFASFRSEEHIRQIQNNITENIVVMSDFNAQRTGNFDDKTIQRGVSIIFASHARNDLDVTAAINAANDTSEEILLDFITEFDKDFEEECGLLRFFQLEKINWESIEGPWLDNYYGWELFIPFKDFLPVHNPDKWLMLAEAEDSNDILESESGENIEL